MAFYSDRLLNFILFIKGVIDVIFLIQTWPFGYITKMMNNSIYIGCYSPYFTGRLI